MSGWDFDSSSNSQKAEFTKFPVGITKIRILDSEPHQRWTHWMPKNKRSVNCPGKGCPICEVRKQQKANKEPYSYAMGKRFSMNIFNLETGKVEIMEQGKTFFEDLRDVMVDLREQGKNLSDAILKVRRRGTSQEDTSYRIDIEEVQPMTNIEKENFESKKIKFDEFFKPHESDKILQVMNGKPWDEVMKANTEDTTEGDDEEVVIQ
jgi:hypothetical protein